MNIHFTDIELFKRLRKSTLVEIEIGSKMYGLEHKDSDTDILCIYTTADCELNSFHMTHHQLQFKRDNIDYIFVNIHNFLRNCMNGDSTINFEVINSEKLKGTCLEFLYNMRKSFYNYKIMRSYLGFAKRDLKHVYIDGKTEFDKNKKIAHAYRGYIFASKILKNMDIFINDTWITYIKDIIWVIEDYIERNKEIYTISSCIDKLRKELNKELDDDNLTTFMKVEEQIKLDKELLNLINSDLYKNKKMVNFNMTMIYDANENGIKY